MSKIRKDESLKSSRERRNKMRIKFCKQAQRGEMHGISMLTLDIQDYINTLEDIVCGKKPNTLFP